MQTALRVYEGKGKMKIALAQIDARLGDIAGICNRIERQARLSADQSVDLLCVPAPLLCGVVPGALTESTAFQGDVLAALSDTARHLSDIDITCLIPMVVPYDGGSLFEVMIVGEGRLAPVRLTVSQHRGARNASPWVVPTFEVAGTRIAVTFDFDRDVTELPAGCDLLVYFQVNGFDRADASTAAVAGVRKGAFRDRVAKAGAWLACMAPIGAFDESVYTGGSFVMDDTGRVVAEGPVFEECLLTCSVTRGMPCDTLPDHDLPLFDRDAWTWEALRLYVRDSLEASGRIRAVVELDGTLPSSLLATLACDALGSRNVFGVLTGRMEPVTPAQEAVCVTRAERAREVAANLHLRLLDMTDGIDSGDGLLARCASEQHALLLSPLTKTDAALSVAWDGPSPAALAPFGDLFLTSLEYLARYRNGVSPVLPKELVCLKAIEEALVPVLAAAAATFALDDAMAGQLGDLLRPIGPVDLDHVLEEHVERGLGYEDIDCPGVSPEARAIILMLVRRGEALRRRMPAYPILSPRSFAERSWPASLAWSDLGSCGRTRASAQELAERELQRIDERAMRRGSQARDELLGMLGGILGVDTSGLDRLLGAPGGKGAGSAEIPPEVQQAIERMMTQGSVPSADSPNPGPFFSLN